ncbi:MAG: hypothetical protein BWY57_00843 [Betaproteobacteria bacterium ADurb.Bin341]|nr:MAG: hypothetical protein BWY57_00843 [Betaproteobacteria bacterium ADurb.Bin341]
MRLVDNDRVVGVEIGIGLRLGQQNAVRHQLDHRLRNGAVVKADFDPHPRAHLRFQFLRQPARHRTRRQPARLRMTDHAGAAAPKLNANFRQLCRLAGAGFAADDDDLVFGDQRRNVGASLVDRQVKLKFRLGQALAALGNDAARTFEQRIKLGLRFLPARPLHLLQFAQQGFKARAVSHQTIGKIRSHQRFQVLWQKCSRGGILHWASQLTAPPITH